MDSILQTEKECYVTHAPGDVVVLHQHHIWGGGLRPVSDEHGFWIWLIPELHNTSDRGIHFDKEFDLKVKRECQAKYEETHTRDEFMKLIGRNYL